MVHRLLASLLLVLGSAGARPADLEIRTYPAASIRAHEIDRTHGVQSLLLQNLAVVNRGAAGLTLERVRFELLRGDVVLQTQTLEADDLAQRAKRGRALADAGQLAALDFQFRPGVLLGDGVAPAATATLAPQEALLVMYRPFLFQGTATALRVTAQGRRADGTSVSEPRAIPVLQTAATGYRFPLRGTWTIAASASFHTAHRWNVAEEFALDVIRMDALGRSHRGSGTRLRDYYAYGEAVLAARAGRVVRVVDGAAENLALLRRPGEPQATYFARIVENQAALLAGGTAAIPGSHVVIDHGDGQFSVYAHLVPHSIPVHVGDDVRAGDRIGRLGHSGNSTEPHLHFQVCDGPDPLYCAGVPVEFDDIELPLSDTPRAVQTGDVVIAR